MSVVAGPGPGPLLIQGDGNDVDSARLAPAQLHALTTAWSSRSLLELYLRRGQLREGVERWPAKPPPNGLNGAQVACAAECIPR